MPTLNQYYDLTDYAQNLVETSWRTTLLVRPKSRTWLAKIACQGIVEECNNVTQLQTVGVQDAIRERVYDYVVNANAKNKGIGESGFVISSIILAAVLSWLIQKLLDHLFSMETT